MNINLLVTDLLPLVTLLYSYGYIKKTGAVTNGNKVKICILLPRKPRIASLSAIGNKVTNDFCVFFVYMRFLLRANERQNWYRQEQPERQYRTAGKIGQHQPIRRRVIAGVTIRPYFTAWQKCHRIFLPLPPKQLKLTIWQGVNSAKKCPYLKVLG